MRPRAGRKPKPVHERLRNRVMVTLTDEEYEALLKAADHEPLTSFIRGIVFRYLARRRK